MWHKSSPRRNQPDTRAGWRRSLAAGSPNCAIDEYEYLLAASLLVIHHAIHSHTTHFTHFTLHTIHHPNHHTTHCTPHNTLHTTLNPHTPRHTLEALPFSQSLARAIAVAIDALLAQEQNGVEHTIHHKHHITPIPHPHYTYLLGQGLARGLQQVVVALDIVVIDALLAQEQSGVEHLREQPKIQRQVLFVGLCLLSWNRLSGTV